MFCMKLMNIIQLQIYPNYNHVVETFDMGAKFVSYQAITERGICHIINAPISRVLANRYFE